MGDALVVLLVIVLILIGLALLILPIVGTVIAVKGNRRAKRALAQLDLLQAENQALQRELKAMAEGGLVEKRVARPPQAAAQLALVPDQVVPSPDAEAAGPDKEAAAPAEDALALSEEDEAAISEEGEAAVSEEGEAAVSEEDVAAVSEEDVAAVSEEDEAAVSKEDEAAVSEEDEAAAPEEDGAVAPEEDEAPAPPAAPSPARPAQSLEEKIGLVWFTRIGALIGVVVVGWFFKYMVDNAWIGPWGRVAIGWLAGGGLLVWGQLLTRRVKKQVHPVFSQGMLGLGLAVLLVSTYASFAFYHLLPVVLAFGLVAVLCVFGGALALFHRSQAILLLALLAALANPIMLSTGVDRPLALFVYLLVMTTLALGLAVRLDFRWVTWFAVAGVMVLFAGWYDRFFDASPPPAPGLYDALPATLAGAYHSLAARLWPLLFAVLFPLLWIAISFGHARRGRPRTALALTLTAAVAAHAAMAGLLYDHPLLLGGALLALGLGLAVLLVQDGRSEWLGLPMAAAFIVLVSLTGEFGGGDLLPMMILTGGLSAIYFGVFLRSASKSGSLRSARALLLLGGAGVGLALVAGIWLLPDHLPVFSLLLTLLSAVYLWLALAVGSVAVIASAFAASLLGLGIACGACEPAAGVNLGFLITAGAWFLIYLGAVSWDLLRKNAPASAGRMAVLTGAGVSFGALFLLATPESAHILRALLSVGAGLCYLLVGQGMLRRAETRGDLALMPLGLAVVFFTLAAAFLLSGPSLTVVWAVEGAVLAWLASRTRREGRAGHPGWLIASAAVFLAACIRMLLFDLPWLDVQYWLFCETQGANGTLLPTAFAHPRAWALAAIGLGLMLGARALARAGRRPSFHWTALAYVLLGHGLLLGLLVTEARILFTSIPVHIPAGLPAEEFTALLRTWEEGMYAQTARLDTVVTVVFGIYSFVLMAIGFGWRSRLHRLLGIALFGLALAKLGLYDIWALKTIYKIVVGASIAALLLSAAFLYGRFGDRIKTLLTEGDKAAGLVLIGLAVSLACGPQAHAAAWPAYASVRPIEGVDGPGDYRLEVDRPLYGASQSDLRDLRIRAAGGDEVPFVLQRVPTPRSTLPAVLEPALLDPVLLPDRSSRVVLDLGPAPVTHNRVRLTLRGRDYLRRVRVESSNDGRQFGLLAEGGYVFHITGRCATTERNEIIYPPTNARFLRIHILPGADENRLRILAATVTTATRQRAMVPLRELPLPAAGPQHSADGETVLALAPLPAGVPLTRIRIEVDGPQFVRRVEVEGSTRRQAWFPVGSGLIDRVVHQAAGDRQPLVDEHLEVDIRPGDHPLLRIRIQDGDDKPLAIRRVIGIYRAQEIIFRARTAGAHTLFVGRTGDAGPHYDLAALLQRSGTADLRLAAFGPLAANPGRRAPAAAHKPLPFTERYALPIQLGIGLVVAVLLIWTGLLIRRTRHPDS